MNLIYQDKNKRQISIKQNPNLLPSKPEVFRGPSIVLRTGIIAVDVLKGCSLALRLLIACTWRLEEHQSLCSRALIRLCVSELPPALTIPLPSATSGVSLHGGFLQPSDTELVFPRGMILAVPRFLKRRVWEQRRCLCLERLPFIRINSVLKLQILF